MYSQNKVLKNGFIELKKLLLEARRTMTKDQHRKPSSHLFAYTDRIRLWTSNTMNNPRIKKTFENVLRKTMRRYFGHLIYSGKFFDVLVRCAKTCDSDSLWKVGEIWIGKERNMAKQLVTDIRFGCVVWHRRMANVLRGMEDTESEARKSVTWRQQTSYRS